MNARIKSLIILAFVMLTLQAGAATTGYPWVTAATVTKASDEIFGIEVIRVGSWSGSLPTTPLIGSMLTNYNTNTATTITTRAALTSSGADSHFDVIVTKRKSADSSGKVTLLTFHSVGQTWTHSITVTGPAMGAGVKYIVTVTSIKASDSSETTESVFEMLPGAASETITKTYGYEFSLAAGIIEQELDRDDDTIPDADDPYPDDATNNGWYAGVNGDTDSDGVLNWDDEYPYDATKGVAGPMTGTGTAATTGNPSTSTTANAAHFQNLTLDNTAGTTSAKFFVGIYAADDGALLGQAEYELAAGESRLVTVGADEAFTTDVYRQTTTNVEGEWVNDLEKVVNGATSTAKTGSSTAISGGTSTSSNSTTAVQTAATSTGTTVTTGTVEGNLVQLESTIKAGMSEISEKLDEVKGTETEETDGLPSDVDSDAHVASAGEIPGKLSALGDSATALVSGLGLGTGVTGNDVLTWAVSLPTGSVNISVEQYADTLSLVRVALLGVISIGFVIGLIKIIRGAFADES